jgi:hypothetical protein
MDCVLGCLILTNFVEALRDHRFNVHYPIKINYRFNNKFSGAQKPKFRTKKIKLLYRTCQLYDRFLAY